MDRGLLTRALTIGFICFILAVGGLYYQSLMVERSNHQYQEITGMVPPANSNDIGALGLMFLIIAGFFVLMIVAGAVTTLASASYWDRPGDIFLASALAGGTPVMLLWIALWCLTLANILLGVFNQETFGYNDFAYIFYMIVANILMVGLGALLAGLSGQSIRALAWRAVRLSG